VSVVCGLDLSLVRAGIAILTDGQPTLVRSVGHSGVAGANYRHRSRRITSQCSAVLGAMSGLYDGSGVGRGIDFAVIEDQLAHGPMLPSALDRSALWWGVYSALSARGIPIAVVNPMTLKVWTTGKGRAEKADMLDAVREWGWSPANHDEADAMALATVGAYHLGDPVPFEIRPRHTSGLEAVSWPEEIA
jgi:hypothetical protein